MSIGSADGSADSAASARAASPIPRVMHLQMNSRGSIEDGADAPTADPTSPTALRLRVLPKVGSPTKSRPKGFLPLGFGDSTRADGSTAGDADGSDSDAPELFSPPPTKASFARPRLPSAQVAINITSDSGDQTAALMKALAAAADAATASASGGRSTSPFAMDGGGGSGSGSFSGGESSVNGSQDGSRNNSETRRSPRGSEILQPLPATGAGSALINRWTPLDDIGGGKQSADEVVDRHHLSVSESGNAAGGSAAFDSDGSEALDSGNDAVGAATAGAAASVAAPRKRGAKKKRTGSKRLNRNGSKTATTTTKKTPSSSPKSSPSMSRKGSGRLTKTRTIKAKTASKGLNRTSSWSENLGTAKKRTGTRAPKSGGGSSGAGVANSGAKSGGRRMRQSKTTFDKSTRPPRAPVPPPA